MENYINKLIIAKDNENLEPFANRQMSIKDLNEIKRETFNKEGITSQLFLATCAKLYDLYVEDEDWENAEKTALTIYQGTTDSDNKNLIKEAQLNLAIAYINNGNLFDVLNLIKTININEEDNYYPELLLVKAKLARMKKETLKESIYLQKAYNISTKKDLNLTVQINILCALALFYDRSKTNDKAFAAYLELANQIAQTDYKLSHEEQVSLEFRLAYVALNNKNYVVALRILSTLANMCKQIFRENHPISLIVEKYLNKAKNLSTNKNT